MARYGTFHSSEIPYVFGTLNALDRPMTSADPAATDAPGEHPANHPRTATTPLQCIGREAEGRGPPGSPGVGRYTGQLPRQQAYGPVAQPKGAKAASQA